MTIPPINHTCCGVPCFQEYTDQEKYPCWGDIVCISDELVEYEDGGFDEYRYAVCEGHIEMWPDYDKNKYIRYNKGNKEV